MKNLRLCHLRIINILYETYDGFVCQIDLLNVPSSSPHQKSELRKQKSSSDESVQKEMRRPRLKCRDRTDTSES